MAFTEQILDELANLSGLQVVAHISSFKFKDRNEDVRKIGQELDVNYILEGSVQYDNLKNRIKITAQLINANNGYHLWSGTYDDDFEKIFEIQESVSRNVASNLRVKILPKEENILSDKLTDNTDAYKLFLESRKYSQLRDDPSLKKGVELLEKAIALGPDFAEAHAELAFLYHQCYWYGSLKKEIRDEKMMYHMERALELDPKNPMVVRANSVYISQIGEYSETDIIEDLREALESKPNYADGHHSLALALYRNGDFEQGLKSMEIAVKLDPLNLFYTKALTDDLFYIHKDYDRALALLDSLEKRNPNSVGLDKAFMIVQEPRR